VELVKFLVANTYLSNGGSILYRYEAAYIDKLMLESLAKARRFHVTFRFIDDVLSVDNPLWKDALADGLYPDALVLNQTNNEPLRAEFLGMNILAVGTRFRMSVFDKRASFPFEVRRYPHVDSLIPSSLPYGVFTGLLHRGFRICSRSEDFLSYALEVAGRLQLNGCRAQSLRNRFRSFLFQQPRKFEARASSISAQFSRSLGSSS
jgi:hypothetical protein